MPSPPGGGNSRPPAPLFGHARARSRHETALGPPCPGSRILPIRRIPTMRRVFAAAALSAGLLLAGCQNPDGSTNWGNTLLLGAGVGAGAALLAGAASDRPQPRYSRGHGGGYGARLRRRLWPALSRRLVAAGGSVEAAEFRHAADRRRRPQRRQIRHRPAPAGHRRRRPPRPPPRPPSTKASPPRGPTICSPKGMPRASMPSGRLIAGWPVRVT